MLFDAQCWPGIVLAKLSAWFRAGMLSARRVGDAVGPASSWRCVRPSIEMATLSAQRRAGDAVGLASSCDGDGNAVGPASDDTVTVAAESWRRCLPGIVLVTLSAAGDTVRVSLAYRPGVVLSARRPRMTLSFQRHLHAITARR